MSKAIKNKMLNRVVEFAGHKYKVINSDNRVRLINYLGMGVKAFYIELPYPLDLKEVTKDLKEKLNISSDEELSFGDVIKLFTHGAEYYKLFENSN